MRDAAAINRAFKRLHRIRTGQREAQPRLVLRVCHRIAKLARDSTVDFFVFGTMKFALKMKPQRRSRFFGPAADRARLTAGSTSRSADLMISTPRFIWRTRIFPTRRGNGAGNACWRHRAGSFTSTVRRARRSSETGLWITRSAETNISLHGRTSRIATCGWSIWSGCPGPRAV